MRPHPLDGVTVVSLEQAVAAPFATRQLADLGARVIKVERPGVGDFARQYDRSVNGSASYFVWLNRGKESIELDIKQPADREMLDALVAQADVFVQNLIPGAVERLGLDARSLRESRADLIYCSVSGYGAQGPYASRKAYDLLVQCETGLVSVTGTPDEPVKVGVSIADVATGMYAYSGILTALFERERSGEGTAIEVTMLDALGEWVSQPTYMTMYGGQPWRRTGARHATIAPYGPFQDRDGEGFFIGVQSDREWALLCTEVIARPDLVDDPRFEHNTERVANVEQIEHILQDAFGRRSVTDLIEQLERVGIANARMRTPEEFAAHPQLQARDRWREVAVPGGSMQALLPPVTVDGREAVMGAVPGLGEHNDAIRAEFMRGQAPKRRGREP